MALVFLLTVCGVRSELKRAGGRAASPQLAPPLRSNVEGLARRGDRGEACWAELFTMFKLDLSAVSAHGRDHLHALGYRSLQGKWI